MDRGKKESVLERRKLGCYEEDEDWTGPDDIFVEVFPVRAVDFNTMS